jgi:hypothetical protein
MKEGHTGPRGDTHAGEPGTDAEKAHAEAPTRLMRVLDGAEAPEQGTTDSGATTSKPPDTSGTEAPTRFLPAVTGEAAQPGTGAKPDSAAGKPEQEAPTQFLPAVRAEADGDPEPVSEAPEPDSESPTNFLPAVTGKAPSSDAGAKAEADAGPATSGAGKAEEEAPTRFLPAVKPDSESPTQFLPAVTDASPADRDAKTETGKPERRVPTWFSAKPDKRATEAQTAARDTGGEEPAGKRDADAGKTDMDAPTRFLRALTGSRPVRRFAGPNRPMHYDSPPAGPPTRYIPAAGRIARPAVPPAVTEATPDSVPAPDPAKPASRSGVTGAGLLTDPFFGPGMAGVAIILWIVGLHPIVPAQIGGAGLIAELSVPLLLSYPLLVGAVVLELLRYQPRNWVLGIYTTLGVFGVYGLQPSVEQVARLPVAWLHAGFSGYIAEHGDILHNYDARFSWAGFFSLVALITKASGMSSAVPLLNWAPVVLSGMSVLGVRALAVSALGNRRASWIAPWLFLAANWTEQDYFSPQGTAMVMLLAALTLTFRHLVRPRLTEPVRARLRARLAPRSSPKARLVAQGAVVLIGLALAVTHQLTPFLLGVLLLLVLVFGRLWPAWLPFVVLGAAVVWFSLGASEFWSGQLIQMILSPLGDISSSVDQGILNRFTGDIGHLVVLLSRVGISVFIAALAAIGVVLMRRDSLRSWLLPVLCVAPFGIAVAQPYGGEVFMRCFLFALPLLALPASIALERAVTAARRWRWRNQPARTIALAAVPWLVVTGLIGATVGARGGNDAYTSFTAADVAAAEWAIGQAQPGQRVDALVNSVPLSFARVGEIEQYEVDVYCPNLDSLAELVGCVRTDGPDYLVLTGPQVAYLRIFDQVPAQYGDQLISKLNETGLYRTVFTDGDATVLRRTAPAQVLRPGGGGETG